MTYTLKTHYKKILADTVTPVSVYLKIRDRFPNSLLLESSDYHANDNSFSYICCNPIASVKVENEVLVASYPDGNSVKTAITAATDIPAELDTFAQKFVAQKLDFKFATNGLFGYMAYDAVRYFEDIGISRKENAIAIPDIFYAVYQNIIAINHFKNEAFIFCHSVNGTNNVDEIAQLLNIRNFASYNFTRQGAKESNLEDAEYCRQVELAKDHCQ
ncbi:MAG: anthranilate synthase component I family protein, partial [Flavobacteriaceae bacterium]